MSGEIRRQQIHVAGQVLPGSRRARHVRLTPEPSLDADLAGHGRDLVGESRECVGHVVDGFGQSRHFTLGGNGQILFQVAVGHRRDDFHDASDLLGQIRRHDIDRVGQILPGAGDARHLRLAAQAPFGADFARHARHLAGETVQLIHHGIDGVLELENFTLHIDGNLARQVAACHGRGHLGDVSHLSGQICRQQVDVVGQVLPRAGDARNHGLAAQPPIGADFACDAGHLTGE